MTAHQYGTLKLIVEYNIHLSKEARKISKVTIGSLAKRGWVVNNGGVLTATNEGLEEYYRYKRPQANYSTYEHDMSDYVRNLLRVGKLIQLRKTG